MPNRVLAIDPGNCTGWAEFTGPHLTAAGIADPPEGLLRCMFGEVVWDAVVIERPTIYPTHLQKGDPNDLIKLAILVGRFQDRAIRLGSRCVLIEPRTWKGQIPKPIHHRRILEMLTPSELQLLPELTKSTRHNMLDAIGLGQWWAVRKD